MHERLMTQPHALRSPLRANSEKSLLVCFSHLRWDFVWQRPQQILSRFGRSRPVLYVEEPVFADDMVGGSLDVSQPNPGVYRVIPRLGGEWRE